MSNPNFIPTPVVAPGQVEQYGVPVPHFGYADHAQFVREGVSASVGMTWHRLVARRIATEGLPPSEPRGEADPRHVAAVAGGRGRAAGIFLVDRYLIRLAADEAGDEPLSHNDLGRIALANTTNAVRPDFSPTAINDINRVYFTSPAAFHPEAGLANAFTDGMTTNVMLGVVIGEETELADVRGFLRVKEHGSGQRPEHWKMVAGGANIAGVEGIDLTLTDVTPPPTEGFADVQEAIRVTSEAHDLADDLPMLAEEERFHAIVETYTADSYWDERGDVRLVRYGDQWYQSTFRVKVDDWSPRQQELLDAARAGAGLPDAVPSDLEGMFVEELIIPVSIDDHPWAHILRELPEGVPANIPTGLILRIVQAFERQVARNGVFIVGDVADIEHPQYGPSASNVSGVAERYKIENWKVAKDVLERVYGLAVFLETFDDMAQRLLPPGSEEYTGGEVESASGSLVFMKVRRPASKEQ